MTKDDIMKLALESGFAKILDEHASEYRNFSFELSQDHYPELGRFIDLVAAHKVEAVIEALREALAQPPLPVQPPSVKVTDEKIKDCLDAADQMYCERDGDKELFMAHAVLAAHNKGAKP